MADAPELDRVILFGAGASYGCGGVYPHPPPLSNALYSRLVEAYPASWGSLTSERKIQFDANFEHGMDQAWREEPGLAAGLLKDLGIYFARFVPGAGRGTAYRTFVQRLRSRGINDVLLSTLNYDCLLDGELSRFGGVNYCFPPGNGIPLVKLHGSCNWFIDFPGPNKYVLFSSDIRVEAPIFSLDTLDAVIRNLTGDNPFHSVMCIYNEAKSAPLAPNFFQQLQADWQLHVLHARQVALVGVRPYPRDEHIWGPLAKTSARLLYVGDKTAYEEWHKVSGRRGETVSVGSRFKPGLKALLRKFFA